MTSHPLIPTLNAGDYVEYIDGYPGSSTVHGVVVGFYGELAKVQTRSGNTWLLEESKLRIIERNSRDVKVG